MATQSITTIAVVNGSTVVSDEDLKAAVTAVQIQVKRDFCPAWALAAPTLIAVSKGGTPPAGAALMHVLDDSDLPGALGYHDDTSSEVPEGKVFAKTDMNYGLSWSITLSHEVLEMIMDPWTNQTMLVQTSATEGFVVAWEACDAVEDDSWGYSINGVRVSDFVLPAYFEPANKVGPYDHMRRLTAPLTIGAGGYLSIFQFGSGWTQKTSGEMGPRLKSKIDRESSRVYRRRHAHDHRA